MSEPDLTGTPRFASAAIAASGNAGDTAVSGIAANTAARGSTANAATMVVLLARVRVNLSLLLILLLRSVYCYTVVLCSGRFVCMRGPSATELLVLYE